MNKKYGTISKEIGAFISPEEQSAADYLALCGYDVLFLAPSRVKGVRTPDIRMIGLLWEIKTPRGNSSRTIENIIKTAERQSRNIVIDLRFTKRDDSKCIAEATRRFNGVSYLNRIFLIKKNKTHTILGS